MTEIWADYSGGRPGGAALNAAGFTGVVRYVGEGSSGKRLTVAEAQDLLAHGVQVRCVVENTTIDANGGYNAGVAAANAALADPAVQAANPAFIYAANDQSGWSQVDVQYVQGFASVLGARAGAYGFGSFLAAVKAAIPGIGSLWQAGPAPSRTGTEGIANLWQRNGTAGSAADGLAIPTQITVNGIACDINNRINQEEPVTDPFTSYSAPAPILNPADGSYSGQDASAATDFSTYERFTNASVRWIIEQHIPALNTAITALTTQVNALNGALSAEQAAVLAAVGQIQAGQVDVNALAAALVTAFMAALKAKFDA